MRGALDVCWRALEPSDVCGGLGRWCACFPKQHLQQLLRTIQLRRLHRALTTPFVPDSSHPAEQVRLLRTIWAALRPGESFCREGEAWKACGFQGKNPATDVRGGGLLAVQCLAHFCENYGGAMRAMLGELERAAAASSDGLRFYPVSSTAIVIVSRLCDLLGLSEGMRGPISSAELEKLLLSSAREHISKLLIPTPRRGGFYGLFSLLLVDFHVRFLGSRANYMMVPQLLNQVLADLEKQVSSPPPAAFHPPPFAPQTVALLPGAA